MIVGGPTGMIDDRLIEAALRLRDDCDAYADRIVGDGLVDLSLIHI